jgi:hypothetical protein
MSSSLNASGGDTSQVAQQALLQQQGLPAAGAGTAATNANDFGLSAPLTTSQGALNGSFAPVSPGSVYPASGPVGVGGIGSGGGGSGNLSQAQNLLAGAAGQFNNAANQNTPRSSGNAGVRLPATTFNAPISNQIQQGGTGAGNSLIQLLQNYKPGTV